LIEVDRKVAMRFVLLLGLVSLLADTTYEGSRSFYGTFLGILGASGTAVGFVAGAGELVGYGVRIFSGSLSDRTGRYWLITIIGYAINLLAVPALALAGNWPMAAALIILERFGKGIRTPARDAMLSHATKQVGHGWGFGVHEALDQIGGVLGPLVVAAVLFARNDPRTGFATLLIPALMALSVLAVARFLYPRPRELEAVSTALGTKGFPRAFWMYLAGVACIAAGFADFPLISFHLGQVHTVPDDLIPVLYAVAMGVDGIAALVFGRLFDRLGIGVLVGGVLVSLFFAPFVFLAGGGNAVLSSVVGVVLWGIGMGAQESIMRAAIAGMVARERRGTAYGVFNTGYGLFWFAGSAVIGILYDVSLPALVVFSISAQLAAIPFLLWTARILRGSWAPPSE
jgi:MFS family permease